MDMRRSTSAAGVGSASMLSPSPPTVSSATTAISAGTGTGFMFSSNRLFVLMELQRLWQAVGISPSLVKPIPLPDHTHSTSSQSSSSSSTSIKHKNNLLGGHGMGIGNHPHSLHRPHSTAKRFFFGDEEGEGSGRCLDDQNTAFSRSFLHHVVGLSLHLLSYTLSHTPSLIHPLSHISLLSYTFSKYNVMHWIIVPLQCMHCVLSTCPNLYSSQSISSSHTITHYQLTTHSRIFHSTLLNTYFHSM